MEAGYRHLVRALQAFGALLGFALAFGWSSTGVLAADSGVMAQATTASYDLTLRIGPMEQMLSADQAKAQHATSGEIMADMAGMGMSMPMAMGNHHVEVKVTRTGTRQPLKSATVAISLTNTASKAATVVDPVVQMYGVAEGEADWHYGNNVQLSDGTYRVDVTVNGERAVFSNVVIGATDSAMAMPSGASTMPTRLPETGAGGGSAHVVLPLALSLAAAMVAIFAAFRRFVTETYGR